MSSFNSQIVTIGTVSTYDFTFPSTGDVFLIECYVSGPTNSFKAYVVDGSGESYILGSYTDSLIEIINGRKMVIKSSNNEKLRIKTTSNPVNVHLSYIEDL